MTDNKHKSSDNQEGDSSSDQSKSEQPSLVKDGSVGDRIKNDGSDRIIDWRPDETKSKG